VVVHVYVRFMTVSALRDATLVTRGLLRAGFVIESLCLRSLEVRRLRRISLAGRNLLWAALGPEVYYS
jgi:hypothetical protein